MKCFFKTAVFLILLSTSAHALLENYGISVFESKMGARAFGMGGAFTFLGGDKNLSFSNPAGLLNSQGVLLSMQGAGLGVVQIFSVGKGTAGIGLISKNMRDISVGSSLYSYSNEYAVLLYAQKIAGFTLGTDIKFILNQELRTGGVSRTGNGWDIDIGLLTAPYPWMSVGALAQNALPFGFFGGGSNAWSDKTTEGIPSIVRLGSGIKIFGRNSLLSGTPPPTEQSIMLLATSESLPDAGNLGDLLIGLDAEVNVNGSNPSLIHAGFEWQESDGSFSFRAGLDQQMRNNAVESVFTAGIGTALEAWNFDGFYNAAASIGSFGISALYLSPEEARKKAEKARSLKIVHPNDNIATTDEKIIVSGEAAGLNVKINGLDVYVRADGGFSAEVPLYVGKNLIRISGAYEDGEIAVKRHVLRNAKVRIKEAVALDKEKERIKKALENILQRELLLASLEARPSLSAKEMQAIGEEKKKLSMEKAILEQKAHKINARAETITVQKEKVEALATLGVVKVEGEKEYETGQTISRAELAMWLVKARGLHVAAVKKNLFPDVRANYWAAPYIQTALQGGLMKAYSDGKFHPEDGVRETEALDILKRFDKLK